MSERREQGSGQGSEQGSERSEQMSDTMVPTESSDSLPLSRPQLHRRRRWARALLATALLAQGTALYFALSRTPETRVVTRVEHSKTTEVLAIPMAPQLVTLPVAAPPTTAELRACPAPRTDAPRFTPEDLPERVQHLAVSPTNAGWIAAWNDTHVFVSTDAGRNFRRTLDGLGDVQDVTFDCFGRVVVLRDDKLGISESGRDTWREVPGIDMIDAGHLVGGGRDVIVVGNATGTDPRARVAITRDLGVTWSYRDLTSFVESSEHVRGVQRADGTIVIGIEVPDCMTDDLAWVEIRPDGTGDEHWITMPGARFEIYGDQVYTAYARRSLDAGDDVEWTRFPEDQYSGTPIRAPYPVLVSDGTATRMVGSTPKALPWIVEGDEHAMDPAGRLWSIVCEQPWIATTRPSGRSCGT